MSEKIINLLGEPVVPSPETPDANNVIPLSQSIPPKIIKRNEYGLIDGLNYVFTEDGYSVDWRKMINPKFLVPHKQAFERFGKPVPKTIEGLEDRELLILLGGIKELAHIRGYTDVRHLPVSPSNDYVISSCSITWLPNFETEGRVISFSDMGDATPFNASGFGKNYLATIAANRAFVRAVRNFLRINILSQEEVGNVSTGPEPETDVSSDLLSQTMHQFGVTWDKLKAKLVEEKYEGAENFKSTYDIPKLKQFELIERIKKKGAVKKS